MSDLQLRRLLDNEQPLVGSGIWSRNAFIRVVLPEPVPPLMMPFFFLPISSTTVSRT